ncbi:transposase [Streptomyces sp. NPDC018833]|uniref:transposase n=1 Tax=Streptomyces sp. NPDC018833 TaxID=3365053 RepID=UPI0037A74CE0
MARGAGQPISCRYLSEAERIRIADLRREKRSIRSIAAELGRSPSTISREIRRNCNSSVRPSHPSYYRPFAAHKRAETRRARPKPRRIETCPELRDLIQARLGEKWSPEQIANILRRQFSDRPEMHVTHETIYRGLYAQARGGLWREISRRLRTGRCMSNPGRIRSEYCRPCLTVHAADPGIPGVTGGPTPVCSGHSSGGRIHKYMYEGSSCRPALWLNSINDGAPRSRPWK